MDLQSTDKRLSPRFPWNRSIQVIPLDDDWKQTGPALEALAKDLSRGGIAFRQPDFLADSHAAIMLQSDARQFLLLLQILRCREVNGEFEIAGRFVAKLSDVENDGQTSGSALGIL